MTTTIIPSSGEGALYTQQGPGTSPGYSALDDRRLATAGLQEGVYGTSTTVTAGGVTGVAAADFMVTQRNSGANASVDINMPGGGMAFVQGDTIAGQGLYGVPVASSNINEIIAAADLTNPRIDQAILEVQDNVLDASGGNLARTRILTGTPSATATLATRAGAATLPGNALLLADILVPSGSSTSISNADIRDRRKWARGACVTITRTSANYTTTSSSFVGVDNANLQPRIELSGVLLEVTLRTAISNSTANILSEVDVAINSTAVGRASQVNNLAANAQVPLTAQWVFAASPGSSLVEPVWLTQGGTATLYASGAGDALEFTVQEIVRPNAANSNGVTTG